MSMEQSGAPERNPIENKSEADKFDANGKPRMTRELPDGSLIWASEQEYADAVQAYNDERKVA